MNQKHRRRSKRQQNTTDRNVQSSSQPSVSQLPSLSHAESIECSEYSVRYTVEQPIDAVKFRSAHIGPGLPEAVFRLVFLLRAPAPSSLRGVGAPRTWQSGSNARFQTGGDFHRLWNPCISLKLRRVDDSPRLFRKPSFATCNQGESRKIAASAHAGEAVSPSTGATTAQPAGQTGHKAIGFSPRHR